MKKFEPRVNEKINASKIRLIDEEGKQMGIMRVEEGLKIARMKGLDLVEVAPWANPVVCKLMEYDKYRFELKKKEKEMKKKQKIVHIKEIKLRPNIENHDYQFKLNHIKKFIESGNKVRISVILSGRQVLHPELAEKIKDRIKEDTKEIAKVDTERTQDNLTIILLSPKHK